MSIISFPTASIRLLWAIEEAILMTRLSIREIMHKCGEFRRDGINAIDLL